MLIFGSGAPRRTNENAKLIITTIVGMVFGFFVGITLPLGAFRKVYEVGDPQVYLPFTSLFHLLMYFVCCRLAYLQALYHLLM